MSYSATSTISQGRFWPTPPLGKTSLLVMAAALTVSIAVFLTWMFVAGPLAGKDHSLIADLCYQVGLGFDGSLNQHQFFELMDQRLLAVDVFVVRQGGEHDGCMRVVGGCDDHCVELVNMRRECFAIVGANESVGVFLMGLGEVVCIDIAQADDLG